MRAPATTRRVVSALSSLLLSTTREHCRVEVEHIDSERLEAGTMPEAVRKADGLLVPMGFGQRGTMAERGSDVEADIMVTLEEALHGSTRQVSLRRAGSKKTESNILITKTQTFC